MARPAKAPATPDDAPVDAPPKMVLKKNHGHISNGRDSRFYPAGTAFDPAADGKLIAELIRSGAIFE